MEGGIAGHKGREVRRRIDEEPLFAGADRHRALPASGDAAGPSVPAIYAAAIPLRQPSAGGRTEEPYADGAGFHRGRLDLGSLGVSRALTSKVNRLHHGLFPLLLRFDFLHKWDWWIACKLVEYFSLVKPH
jgi:hypothetical protein